MYRDMTTDLIHCLLPSSVLFCFFINQTFHFPCFFFVKTLARAPGTKNYQTSLQFHM
jgi:hypothetical protein